VDDAPDLDLLRLVADDRPDGVWGAADLAQEKFDRDRAAGRSAQKTSSPPYFGLDRPLFALERAGFIEIDPGVAAPVLPGSPASGPSEAFIIITELGRAALDLD
jgi:hypothetical protein